MEFQVEIAQQGWTDISQYTAANIRIKGMGLKGKGVLRSCLLTFSKEGDYHLGQKDVFFFTQENDMLVPYGKSIELSEYRFCSVQVLTGNVFPDDVIILHLFEE